MSPATIAELRERLTGKVVVDVREGRQEGSLELLLTGIGHESEKPEIVLAVMAAVVTPELRQA